MSMYFCILTNVVALLPTWILIKWGHWGDGVFTFATGLASLLYHTDEFIDWQIKTRAIRDTDIIMADMLVFHTADMFWDFENRWAITANTLPFHVYSSHLSVEFRFACMIVWASTGIIRGMWVTQRRGKIWMGAGTIIILLELLAFSLGNAEHYGWLHGLHHIAAFSAQACFVRALKYI